MYPRCDVVYWSSSLPSCLPMQKGRQDGLEVPIRLAHRTYTDPGTVERLQASI